MASRAGIKRLFLRWESIMDMKQMIKKRGFFVGIVFTMLFFLLIYKTFHIQVIEAAMLQEKAKNIWNRSTILEPQRGTMYDRNKERLAYNASAYTVIAVLSDTFSNHVINKQETAQQLAPLLKMKEADLIALLSRDAYQVELRPGGWKINKEIADEVKGLNLPGIILKDETKRYYFNNSLAAYALGFVNYDNEAIMGLEREYNQVLSGKQGKLQIIKDLKGYQLPDGKELFQPSEDGKDLILTLDKTIQQYVESALDKAYAMYNPKKIVAIVADPQTGEILAMSNRPTYNPNQYWEITDYRNLAIQYQFEPGSTFKIVTLAAAIEEGVFDPEETYMSGKIKVPGKVIHDHNNGVGWGEISFLEGVQRSSNVAFVHLGYERLGKEKLFFYIHQFGFGQKTGIDLSNESSGIMKDPETSYPLDVATMSFGQGVAVTPIQQVMAVSAVANGGKLMQPYLVKEIRDPKTGEVIHRNEPIVKRRVISEDTARKTSQILESVVSFGTQKPGYIEGYHVAGKTGTAQKIGADGTYLKNKNIVSFIGYAPAQDPKLIVYVAVDEPDLNIPYYGSTVAAPIFKEIMQNSLRYLKVPIDSSKMVEKKTIEMKVLKNYVDQSVVASETDLLEKGVSPIIIGYGSTVLRQYPEKGSLFSSESNIYLVTDSEMERKVPDLRGKSLRDALEYCYVLNMDVHFTGSGMVREQSIKPGSIYRQGQTLELILVDPANFVSPE